MTDWNKVRKDFPVTEKCVYFLSAGMSPMPRPVLDVVTESYKRFAEYGDILWGEENKLLKKVRSKIGSLISASGDDVAFVANTSTVMSLMALSFKEKHGKNFNIVSMEDEFPATTVPYEYQGIKMKYAKPKNGRYPILDILNLIDNETVAVVTSYVQYATGFRQDLTKLGAELKKRNVLFIVNATQGFPIFPVDVKKMNIDAMSVSLHKWGMAGYVGAAFYTSPEYRKKYRSPVAGWLSVQTKPNEFIHTDKNVPFQVYETADRYNIGSVNWQTFCALDESLKYMEGIGWSEIETKIFELTDCLIAGLKKLPVDIISPVESKDERSSIVSIKLSKDVAGCMEHLKSKNIYPALRNGNIRISLNIFNSNEEIDRLLAEVGCYLGGS